MLFTVCFSLCDLISLRLIHDVVFNSSLFIMFDSIMWYEHIIIYSPVDEHCIVSRFGVLYKTAMNFLT